MKRAGRFLANLLLLAGFVAIVAVCWHSVGEIHYLKTFFPPRFTVQEACEAAIVEAIKVGLIVLPILLGMGLVLLWTLSRRPDRSKAPDGER